MSEFLTTPEIDEAWDRIARTPDGGIIYRHLMKLLLEVSNDERALPRNEGARSLAHNLMRLMANGIVDNDRYCVAFPSAKPERTDQRAARGAGPRIGPEHFVPGYDIDRTGVPYDNRTSGGTGTTGTGSNGTGGAT
jgi:hypothetical protein